MISTEMGGTPSRLRLADLVEDELLDGERSVCESRRLRPCGRVVLSRTAPCDRDLGEAVPEAQDFLRASLVRKRKFREVRWTIEKVAMSLGLRECEQ